MSTLLLITSAPTSIYAWHALGLAQALQAKNQAFRVFFYQDGVSVANALQWTPDDQRHLTEEWQKAGHSLTGLCQCCLGSGYYRSGQCKRHQISQHNLAQGFELVGLGELADAVQSAQRLVQF